MPSRVATLNTLLSSRLVEHAALVADAGVELLDDVAVVVDQAGEVLVALLLLGRAAGACWSGSRTAAMIPSPLVAPPITPSSAQPGSANADQVGGDVAHGAFARAAGRRPATTYSLA